MLRPLLADHPWRFRIAPLTVLVDPVRARALARPDADPDLAFLFAIRSQRPTSSATRSRTWRSPAALEEPCRARVSARPARASTPGSRVLGVQRSPAPRVSTSTTRGTRRGSGARRGSTGRCASSSRRRRRQSKSSGRSSIVSPPACRGGDRDRARQGAQPDRRRIRTRQPVRNDAEPVADGQLAPRPLASTASWSTPASRAGIAVRTLSPTPEALAPGVVASSGTSFPAPPKPDAASLANSLSLLPRTHPLGSPCHAPAVVPGTRSGGLAPTGIVRIA